MACDDDVDCNTTAGDDGTCALPTREDVLLGLEGYCLEKDTGININGDRDQGACLTWLPVDQLAGSTDLYAKFTEAGFYDDTFACSFVSPFVNLTMSDHPEPGTEGEVGEIACASFEEAADQGDTDDEAKLDICANNVVCPAGYWAMMSMPHSDVNGLGTIADACTSESNDCAYVCIPLGATTIDEEGVIEEDSVQSCDPDSEYVVQLLADTATEAFAGAAADANYNGIPASVRSGWSYDDRADDVKILSVQVDGDDGVDTPLYTRFDNMVTGLENCSLKAVEFDQDIETTIFNRASDDGDLNWLGNGVNGVLDDTDLSDAVREGDDLYSWSNDTNYHDLFLNGEFYAACEEVVRVVDGNAYKGYPWTNKLLGPDADAANNVTSSIPGLDLTIDITPGPYGLSVDEPVTALAVEGENNWPYVVATCEDLDVDNLEQPFGEPPTSCSSTQGSYIDGGSVANPPSGDLQALFSPGNPMARSLVDFRYLRGFSERNNWSAAESGASAFDIITQLFAGVDIGVNDNEYIWNDVDGDDNNDEANWPSIDRKYTKSIFNGDEDVRAEEGNPPTVWSLLSGSCSGTMCEEGDDNSLTLNDQNNGDHEGHEFFRAYL
jgi:hypothetical protein